MKRSSVAVVIPTYNRYRYLREAIVSVLQQTRPADEVVVVDDGSSDETPQVAREFPGIRYLPKPNGGLSQARNYGAQHTSSDLLVFLDDDDRLAPDALFQQAQAFEADDQLALVYGRADLIDEKGARIGEHLRNHRPPPNALEALLIDNYILVQTVMVRRRHWEQVGGFRSLLGEDLDLYLRLALAGGRFCFLDRVLAEYRKQPGTMSAHKLKYAQAMLAMLQGHLDHLPPGRSRAYYTAFYQYRVGRAALEEKNWRQARQSLRQAVRGRPGQPHFWLYYGVALFPQLLLPMLRLARAGKRRVQKLLTQLGWREQRWGG